MAVVYRAMWEAGAPGLVDQAARLFADWVAEKSDGGLVVPGSGSAEAELGYGSAVVTLERSGPDPDLGIDDSLRASFVENLRTGTQWTTTLRAWSGPACLKDPRCDGGGRVWVDVENVMHDSFTRQTVRAPRLVRSLLDAADQPVRRGLALSHHVRDSHGEDGAERLAAEITALERDLPMVVFSPPLDDPSPAAAFTADELDDQMRRAARAVAGMATVSCLDDAAAATLGQILGPGYTVWSGAFRIFQPGADPALGDEWRHRFVLPERFGGRYREAAANLVVRSISPNALSRRAEPSHEAARVSLRRAFVADLQGDTAKLAGMFEEENRRLEKEVQAAQELMSQTEEKYSALVDEQQTLLEENAELRDRLARSLEALQVNGLAGADAPQWARYPTQAVEFAQEYLADHLVIHEDACEDMLDLDSAVESGPWGQLMWEALRALHAYAVALADTQVSPGSFQTWCQSGAPRAWRASNKKLAMTESSSVRNNPKHQRQRVLPVSTDVSPDGRIEMLAHIKIAQGGGPLAPRIYFHVDSDAAKVHVGYIGPHRRMTNTKT